MPDITPFLFVYGSLRSGFQNTAYAYISQYFTLVSPAKANGKLYDLDDFPAAVPDDSAQHFIVGELYQINDADEFSWAIAQLDDYEGLYTENEEIPLYRRKLTTVYWNNQQEKAWVYWYNGNVEGKPLIASGDVLLYKQEKNKSGKP